MIPLRDNIPSRTTPIVNYAVIALCSIVFLKQASSPAEDFSMVEQYAMIPARVTQPDQPLELVVDVKLVQTRRGLETVEVKKQTTPPVIPTWLTMVTCVFLHGSWMHLIGNMWILWIFGDNVEDRFGHVGYLIFFLFGGAMASLVHYLTGINSTTPTVGASGAIAAVMGAYFVWYPHAQIRTFLPVLIFPLFFSLPAAVFLGIWFVMQFLNGTTSMMGAEAGGVAWWAHIGGFAAGYLIAGVMGKTKVCNSQNPERRVFPTRPPVFKL